MPEGVELYPCRVNEQAADWIVPKTYSSSAVLLYLHGGGFVFETLRVHEVLVGRIALAAGVKALIPNYRVAPEYPFPAAVDDVLQAYRFLLKEGYTSEQIILGGDSAGGGLVFSTLIALRDAGEPQPAAAFTLSPWVDLEASGESMKAMAEADPCLDQASLLQMAAIYLDGADSKAPLASPLYADLSGLPPLYIQVGTAEILLDDSRRIAERARLAGVQVKLECFEDLIHVFQGLAPTVPEATFAIERLARFVQEHLAPPSN